MARTIEDRVELLETMHQQGGVCEEHRAEFWKEVNALKQRIVALEVKLLVGGAAIGILGPLAAQWIFKRLGG